MEEVLVEVLVQKVITMRTIHQEMINDVAYEIQS